jgi:chemotaxis protein MotB
MRPALTKRAFPAAVAGLLATAACVSEQQHDELEEAYRRLQAHLRADEATIERLQGRLKVTMAERVLFPSGGWHLDERAQRLLYRMVPTLQGLRRTRVVVEGFTDTTPIGPELQRQGIRSNLDLSSRRADAVADYFVVQRVPRSYVSARGFGEAKPVASNDTPEGRARNRRIEVVLVGPGG